MWILQLYMPRLHGEVNWQNTGGQSAGRVPSVFAYGNGEGCPLFDYWEPNARFTLPQLIVFHATRSRRC